jgi:nucleotide-binding universal stress UspA family protein
VIRTILVPLDGSPHSEQALPLAAEVARRAHAGLRLACVLVPKVEEWTQAISQPYDEQAMLDLAAQRVRQAVPDGPVQTAVLEGPVAETLARHAADVRADLIVLTTHGRGAFSRFWLGSVTDEMLRCSPVPLLVLRPAGAGPTDAAAEAHVRRVVVPLDGSEFAEAALGPAAALSRLYGAGLELLRVVAPLPAVGPDGVDYVQAATDAAILGELTRQAGEALETTAERLRRDGLTVTTRVAVHDHVAAAVLEATRPGDVVALATHGRRAMVRWLLGSVADKLVRGAEVPVLVVRPTGGAAAQHPNS